MRRLEIPGFNDLAEIGRGASAVVYRAWQPAHERPVAIKVLSSTAPDPVVRLGFERELRTMARLADHPNIVDLLESGFSADGHPYLVMPWYQRGNYAARVDRDGPLGWVELVDVAVKLASALHTAHARQVIHRDVKPANMFMASFAGHPILADFGISSFARPSLDGAPTVALSTTPLFGAPEVLAGERPDASSDLYSLGATLFSLGEGRAAYAHTSIEVVLANVCSDRPPPRPALDGAPGELAELIMAMMAKSPTDRPASLLVVADRLVAIQRAAGLDATPIVTDGIGADPGPAPALMRDRPSSPTISGAMTADPGEMPLVTPAGAMTVDPGALPLASLAGAVTGDRVEPQPVSEPDAAPVAPLRRAGLDQPTVEVRREDRRPEPGTVVDEPEPGAQSRPGPNGWRRKRWLAPILAVLMVAGVAATRIGRNDDRPVVIIDKTTAGAWDGPLTLVTSVRSTHGPVRAVAATDGSSGLAIGSEDGTVEVVPATGEPPLVLAHDGWILDLAPSPDQTLLAVATANGMISLWRTADGVLEGSWQAHTGSAESIDWAPDGSRLVSGGSDGQLILWQLDGTRSGSLPAHGAAVLTVDWSPDSERIAAGGKDGVATVSTPDGQPVATLEHPDWVRSVVWYPDGSRLATSGADGAARTWVLATTADAPSVEATSTEATWPDAGDDLSAPLVLSPDGRYLAGGDVGGRVLVWSTTALDRPPVSGAGDGAVLAVTWSGDGSELIVGRQDGTVEHWQGAAAGG